MVRSAAVIVFLGLSLCAGNGPASASASADSPPSASAEPASGSAASQEPCKQPTICFENGYDDNVIICNDSSITLKLNGTALEVRCLSAEGASACPSLALGGRRVSVAVVAGCAPPARGSLADWLTALGAAPASLTNLTLTEMPLTQLSASYLHGLNLTNLTVTHSRLERLPSNLFDQLGNLHSLDLSNNSLSSLPSGIFKSCAALQLLWLDDNELNDTSDVLDRLQPLRKLTNLSLAGNRRLHNFCTTAYDDSKLKHLGRLELLSLRNTSITIICQDWRMSLRHLKTLDLRNTKVTELKFIDLEYERHGGGAEVLLQGAGVRRVVYGCRDVRRPPPRAAVLRLDRHRPLACDCRMYHTRLALAAAGVPVEPLRCAGGPLRAVPPDDMLCAANVTCAAVPPHCRCGWVPDGRVPDGWVPDCREPASVVRVVCERARLDRVPRLPADLAFRADLMLAHNSISVLDAADFPPMLRTVDLHNNTIERMDAETTSKLLNASVLLLADNRLECGCEAAPLTRALLKRQRGGGASGLDAREGRAPATCNGGAALEAAAGACVPPLLWALGALAAALALALAALAALAAPARRLRALACLYDRGLLRPGAATDGFHPFDVFLSFAEEDAARAEELQRLLESAPRPYRVCQHHRDWAPGHWVGEQVEASVRRSRRTLALVSRHYVRPGARWTRAEFREAHARGLRDGTPRLLLVLLQAEAELALDAELRSYVRRYPRLRWSGDADFWPRLRALLPVPGDRE